jgi:dipeptidyl aminopeptidase/acylaminoacyl peptidase
VQAGAGVTLVAIGSAAGKGADRAGPPTGGGTSASLVLHQASAPTLALSPDHQTIAMNLLGNLWTLPASGGSATRTTSLQQDTAYPDWSPDGKTIAFQSYKSGTFHIWAMNPDGSDAKELTSGFYDDREPQFSPDGTKIVFSSDRPPAGAPAGTATRSYNLWTLTLATGQLTEITHASGGTNYYYPTWSPDGKQITYVDGHPMLDDPRLKSLLSPWQYALAEQDMRHRRCPRHRCSRSAAGRRPTPRSPPPEAPSSAAPITRSASGTSERSSRRA